MLNPEAPVPLYRQLADELEEGICSGRLPVGERLPSEHELASLHKIGRPTVRQATDHLVRRGLVERRRGSGTFVVGPQPTVDLFTLGGTTAAFEDAGIRLLTSVVEPVQRLDELDAEAGPLASQAGYRFARVGRVDAAPVLLERMYLEASVFPAFDTQEIDREPLSRLVERKYHRRPNGGYQTIRTHQLAADDARLLEVAAGSSALLIERTLQFRAVGTAIFTRIFALTDRVMLAQSLTEPLNVTCVLARREERT